LAKQPKIKKQVPFEFALDALAEAHPYTRPMFGCTAVYVKDQIVLVLRDRDDSPKDRGVWLATTAEHHASLKKDFPSLRSIQLFGPGETGWQVLPVDADDFEELVLKACGLILKGDSRIGKVPKGKAKRRR
jgi:hypothetical protein